jgi:pyridoxine 5-phosphate synthase
MIHLGVNIDHVATLRQARYRATSEFGGMSGGEPDPVAAAFEAELGGADCITVHLREDRRHIVDRDVELIRKTVRVKLNLEMAATEEMAGIAVRTKVHMATLVPEGRQELTTEGGLDVAGNVESLRETVKRLKGAGVFTSAFIDAELPQIEAAHAAGFDACEVHTGPYARAFAEYGGNVRNPVLGAELGQVAVAGGEIRAKGMRFNAGHALNYANVRRIAEMPGISELHIGHAIVCRAVWIGLREAVREMKANILSAWGHTPNR